MTTPTKPEPVETAEEFATNLKECTAPCCDDCAAAVRERDAALVAEAEARGARNALEDLLSMVIGPPGSVPRVNLHDAERWNHALDAMFSKLAKGGTDGG